MPFISHGPRKGAWRQQRAFAGLLIGLLTFQFSSGLLVPRDDGPSPPDPGSATIPDPGLIPVPDTGKADNTFSNGAAENVTSWPYSSDPIPAVYQPRDIDLPFGRWFHGKMTMFTEGQLNQPDRSTDEWTPNQFDSANQSACGIPDNAYLQNKVAIHPYFLKFAGLDRYCMQDVCVSLWPEQPNAINGGDMIVKVTDICSTDPSDPTHCDQPSTIKIDRAKVQVMFGAATDDPVAAQGVYWHLTKCWTNGRAQPAYADNWFAKPPLPNNANWDNDATKAQTQNNQKSYPGKSWDTYPDLDPGVRSTTTFPPVTDWVPGQEPAWAPIAGGKGFGTPERSTGPPPGLYPGKSTALARGGAAPSAAKKKATLRRPKQKGASKVKGKVQLKKSEAKIPKKNVPKKNVPKKNVPKEKVPILPKAKAKTTPA